jgi:hypothetical protein
MNILYSHKWLDDDITFFNHLPVSNDGQPVIQQVIDLPVSQPVDISADLHAISIQNHEPHDVSHNDLQVLPQDDIQPIDNHLTDNTTNIIHDTLFDSVAIHQDNLQINVKPSTPVNLKHTHTLNSKHKPKHLSRFIYDSQSRVSHNYLLAFAGLSFVSFLFL